MLGTNGSGKSTLLKTLVGPAAAARRRRREVLGAAPGASPARVAYLGQFQPSGFVLPLRASDVVAMGRFPARGLLGRMRADDRRRVRREHGAHGRRRTWPTRRSGRLSGGQRQRVH